MHQNRNDCFPWHPNSSAGRSCLGTPFLLLLRASLLPCPASDAFGATPLDAGLVPGGHLVKVGADGACTGALTSIDGRSAAHSNARMGRDILRNYRAGKECSLSARTHVQTPSQELLWPHTLARPPILLMRRSEVHTLSHTKFGSAPTSGLHRQFSGAARMHGKSSTDTGNRLELALLPPTKSHLAVLSGSPREA